MSTTRNRQRDFETESVNHTTVDDGDRGDELFEEARALAREGDDIIDDVLSHDSRHFLAQNRQQSGQ